MIERLLRIQLISVGEKEVDRFKSRPSGLGVKCPYEYRIHDVEHRKDHIGLVPNVLECWWGDLNDNKMPRKSAAAASAAPFARILRGRISGG